VRLFFARAADKSQSLFQRRQRNAPLQMGDLVAKLFRGRREDAGVKEIFVRIPNAVIVQDQQQISLLKLREQQ